MTTGEYIKLLLKQKSVTVSELSSALGLSSRNVLYRLFNRELSSEKQKKLIDAIVENVSLSEQEKETLYRLMAEEKDGKFADEVKSILENINVPDLKRHAVDSGGRPLPEILRRFKGRKTFIISGIEDERIIQDIYDYLKKSPKTFVYHYMKFPKGVPLAAYEILALIKLSKFPNYIPLEAERDGIGTLYIASKNGREYHLQISEFSEGGTDSLETEITAEMYKYIVEKNAQIQNKCSPIKKRIQRVENHMETLGETLEIEEGDSFYYEGAPCFGYLPVDILYDMFKGIGFFGYPESHPHIQYLIEHMAEKNKRLYSLGHKRFVYDEKHIRDMMQTGIATDHISEFPPLTIEQRRRYFKWLVDYLKRGDGNIRCRMLKGITIEHSFVYEKGHMLYMYRPNTKLKDMDVSIIMLRNKNVDEIMKYFTEYIWEKFTVSEEETAQMLSEMADKYLGI